MLCHVNFLKLEMVRKSNFSPAMPYKIQKKSDFALIEIIQHWNFPTVSTKKLFLGFL